MPGSDIVTTSTSRWSRRMPAMFKADASDEDDEDDAVAEIEVIHEQHDERGVRQRGVLDQVTRMFRNSLGNGKVSDTKKPGKIIRRKIWIRKVEKTPQDHESVPKRPKAKKKKKKKRPKSLPVMPARNAYDDPDHDNIDEGVLEPHPDTQKGCDAAKNRLLEIVAQERIESADPDVIQEEPALESDPDERSSSFFQRGSHFVRTSLRKIMSNVSSGGGSKHQHDQQAVNDSKKSSTKDKAKLQNSNAGSKTNQGMSSESQDSGLGDDSENDTSLRTPTPHNNNNNSNTFRRSKTTSSFRKITACSFSSAESSSSTNAIQQHSGNKKHVMIREPSLTNLPSSQRLLRAQMEQHNTCNGTFDGKGRATVRIYSRSSRLPRATSHGGDVSGQWGRIFAAAYAEVVQNVPECDLFTLKLIFDTDLDSVRCDLSEVVTAVDDVAELVHSVYRVLFFDWTQSGCRYAAIVVHCVQRFLVVVVDVAEMDMEQRIGFAKTFRDLLRSSELTRYSNLSTILSRTRTVYVQFWCALLNVSLDKSLSQVNLVKV